MADFFPLAASIVNPGTAGLQESLDAAAKRIGEQRLEIGELKAALSAVHRIIVDASMTGFNCHEGDWAERLFFSQQATSRALRLYPAPAAIADELVEVGEGAS